MLASGGGHGAGPAEIASLMRAAGLPPDGRYLVAAMGVAASAVVTGPNADRWRCDLAGELAMPLAEGVLVAPLGEEIVALIPCPGDPAPGDPAPGNAGPGNAGPDDAGPDDAGPDDAAPDDRASPAHRFAAEVRAALPVAESDRCRVRLAVGVSAPAEGVIALSGALHEAGCARRLAALSGAAAVSVVTSDEVASHELLLATVPASVLRSFRERLLGPLLAYDDRHRAELLPTLREFLACSGSWNACAAKMYVHVNTVRYRIRRIEELTGRDLSSLDDQVNFFLALRIG
jgi:PucR C-terminal helix-turn-helix domain/GGDEF-like domain